MDDRLSYNSRKWIYQNESAVKKKLILDADVSYLVQAGLPLIFNIPVIMLIISRKKLFSKKSSKFTVNLQTVHILLCITGIVYQFHQIKVLVIVSNGLLIALFLSLILITTDRCLIIKYPFKYEHIKTKIIALEIISTWTIIFIYMLLFLKVNISGYYRTLFSTVMLGIAAFSLILSNVTMYVIAKRHVRAIRRFRTEFDINKKKRVLKSTYVCLSFVVSFLVSWIPLFVHNVITFTGAYQPKSTKIFTQVVVRMAMVNSMLDPFLYLYFNRDAKSELKTIFTGIERQSLKKLSVRRRYENFEKAPKNPVMCVDTAC